MKGAGNFRRHFFALQQVRSDSCCQILYVLFQSEASLQVNQSVKYESDLQNRDCSCMKPEYCTGQAMI